MSKNRHTTSKDSKSLSGTARQEHRRGLLMDAVTGRITPSEYTKRKVEYETDNSSAIKRIMENTDTSARF